MSLSNTIYYLYLSILFVHQEMHVFRALSFSPFSSSILVRAIRFLSLFFSSSISLLFLPQYIFIKKIVLALNSRTDHLYSNVRYFFRYENIYRLKKKENELCIRNFFSVAHFNNNNVPRHKFSLMLFNAALRQTFYSNRFYEIRKCSSSPKSLMANGLF